MANFKLDLKKNCVMQTREFNFLINRDRWFSGTGHEGDSHKSITKLAVNIILEFYYWKARQGQGNIHPDNAYFKQHPRVGYFWRSKFTVPKMW